MKTDLTGDGGGLILITKKPQNGCFKGNHHEPEKRDAFWAQKNPQEVTF